jgi:hypothetical protein
MDDLICALSRTTEMITLFTFNGTASNGPTDPGQFPWQTAMAILQNPWATIMDYIDGLPTPPPDWAAQPIDYPYATLNMGASVNTGVANGVAAIQATPGLIALGGYSQGAIVTSHIWRDYILSPTGSLHSRLSDIKAAVNWGNPCRCPNVANGNLFAGWPMQAGGGISGADDLTSAQTPPWWLDFADANDLYTDCPVGTGAGEDETLIYGLIMTQNFGGTLEGLLKLVETAVEELNQPLTLVLSAAEAIWNGLKFAAAGPAAGHYTYNIGPAITYLQQVGQQYAGQS